MVMNSEQRMELTKTSVLRVPMQFLLSLLFRSRVRQRSQQRRCSASSIWQEAKIFRDSKRLTMSVKLRAK